MMQKKSTHIVTNKSAICILKSVIFTFHFVIILFPLLCSAQDLHFSQLFFNSQNLNPAEIGFFDGDIRANTVIRNQWKSIPVPYQTSVIAIDFAKIKKIKNTNVGLLFNNDKSGDSHYTQNQILLGLSKLFKLNTDSTFLFSVGIQEGFFSNSFQTNKQTFDSQFNGTLYDQNMPNGESFSSRKKYYFNTNFGSTFAYRYSAINTLKLGLSANNLFSSKLSFFNNNLVKSNPKIIAYFCVDHTFKSGSFVLPYVGFIQREKNKEFTIGASFGKRISSTLGQNFKPYLGLFFRNKDAYFLQFGTFYNQFNLALSYDVNYSKLKTATNNRGAIELILVYIFKKPKPFIVLPKHCPVFL